YDKMCIHLNLMIFTKIIRGFISAELEESNLSTGELHSAILEDLDSARDYPGFNVKIEIVSQQE
ncbi:hypothetical protein, partial [Enterobacter cloacae complex sp. CDL008]|uniref:hypothetical protein n=1 Tax=unclassified Enterobacter cloacae complex TaxID=2757714 RepID=UPI003BA3F1CD